MARAGQTGPLHIRGERYHVARGRPAPFAQYRLNGGIALVHPASVMDAVDAHQAA